MIAATLRFNFMGSLQKLAEIFYASGMLIIFPKHSKHLQHAEHRDRE